jgi:hypothetical protein
VIEFKVNLLISFIIRKAKNNLTLVISKFEKWWEKQRESLSENFYQKRQKILLCFSRKQSGIIHYANLSLYISFYRYMLQILCLIIFAQIKCLITLLTSDLTTLGLGWHLLTANFRLVIYENYFFAPFSFLVVFAGSKRSRSLNGFRARIFNRKIRARNTS